jgi:hypothetical protein
MAWSAQLTYVVADGGPAAIVVLLLVHVATPVDTRRAIVDTTGDPLHAIQGPTVWVWGVLVAPVGVGYPESGQTVVDRW